MEGWNGKGAHGGSKRRKFCGCGFRAIRNVIRNVFFHLNDSVCHVEVRTGASGNENRRDAELLIQIPHAADKRCDRFLAVGNDALHQLIAHHKVGGGRILIDQKEARAGFDALDHVGSLRGASAGIGGRE